MEENLNLFPQNKCLFQKRKISVSEKCELFLKYWTLSTLFLTHNNGSIFIKKTGSVPYKNSFSPNIRLFKGDINETRAFKKNPYAHVSFNLILRQYKPLDDFQNQN